jgi:hypothetical protein
VADGPLVPLRGPSLHLNLQRRRALVTALIVGFLLAAVLVSVPGAGAQAYLPAPGQSFQGVTGQPVASYERAVGKHPAVYQVFSAWGEYLPGMFADAAAAHARLMIHITTASGTREMITPAGIASGAGDAWLIALNNAIAAGGRPVYIRLMAEMDGSWNPYSAYDATGAPRGAAHSTREFRLAWKRVTLILRGGSLRHIDGMLRRLGLPLLRTRSDLPAGKVAMLWVPQVAGSPAIAGNQPRAYWPGRAWVDWVGTDFYSKFPNFPGLTSFYNAFPGAPFVFGEWAMWGGDDPNFVSQLFSWARSHPRTRMLMYNEGMTSDGPFRLSRYPGSAQALRAALASPRYPAFTPDWSH